MFIKRVFLRNFKNFLGDNSFKFDKLTLVTGDNGSGKTTITVDALLFAIYGYASQSLDKLPTKEHPGNCLVRVEFTSGSDEYIVEREIPSKLRIFKNGSEVKRANLSEKQAYLNEMFKNVEYFRKFRMIDTSAGINLLEEGKTSLRKTLLSFDDDIFKTVRQLLLDKKRERETFNKDKVGFKFVPSAKKLERVNRYISNNTTKLSNIEKTEKNALADINKLHTSKGKIQQSISTVSSQQEKLASISGTCPTCFGTVDEKHKNTIIDSLEQGIERCHCDLEAINEDFIVCKKALDVITEEKLKINKTTYRAREVKGKLETALKQADFKYTKKDVVIADRAIKELDKFYSDYLVKQISVLEPIINSVLEKIGFSLSFTPDFDIVLKRAGQSYTYKELSLGQRLIVSIAFKLALLIERNEEGIIVADEGFSSLSEDNLNYIFKLFKDFPFQLVSVIHRFSTEDEEVKVINL